MQEENYRKIEGISSSMIKDFRKMPPLEFKKIWITKEKESKRTAALDRGNITDDLLFNPKCIDDKYIITEIAKPSDSISFIIDNVFSAEKNLPDLEDKIFEIAKITPMKDEKGVIKLGFGTKWKEETLLKKVIDDGGAYFEFLKTTNGKCVISNTDYMTALMMVEKARASELVKPYLDPNYNEFQFSITTKDDYPFKLKGCLDIKHEKDNDIRVVDFKTADSAYYFEVNVRKFNYLDQVSFYDNLLQSWQHENNNHSHGKPPINIVMDRTYMIPYIYEYNWKDVEAAWTGYFKYGKWQKGLKDWIAEIQWHIAEDLWMYPMEHYLYNKISLNLISHKE